MPRTAPSLPVPRPIWRPDLAFWVAMRRLVKQYLRITMRRSSQQVRTDDGDGARTGAPRLAAVAYFLGTK